MMDRNDIQTTSIFQSLIQQTVQSSEQIRNSGSDNWWRPLEAALACIGSQAESIEDCIEDEQDSDREKPIDIEGLLRDIVPNVLGLQRELHLNQSPTFR